MTLSKAAVNLSFIAAGLLAFQGAVLADFSDVQPNHPNKDAIVYVQREGIVSGYSDGTFRSENAINRAEFIKIVTLFRWGQEMVDMCGSRNLFSDLDTSAWYIKYICRARDSHMIDGYPNGTFRPDQKINFAEAAKIIATASTQTTSDPRLPEVDTGALWYEAYVRFLAERNAIPLSIQSFDKKLSRGEMAEIIYRLDAGISSKPSQTYETLNNNIAQPTTWKTYINADQKISFSYPSTYSIITDQVWNPQYDREKEWYRIELQDKSDPQQPIARFEVNPDGYGPFFSDRSYVLTENKDGTVRIASSEERTYTQKDIENLGLDPRHDGNMLLIPKNLESRNGNVYSIRFNYIEGKQNIEPIFRKIVESIILAPSLEGGTYRNTDEGYVLNFPKGWNFKEGENVNDVLFDSLLNNVIGTKFIPPGEEALRTFIFAGTMATCPDLSKTHFEKHNVVINGKTFLLVGEADGAAGSIGETGYYFLQEDSSPCFFIVTHTFHSTGEAYDEPMRTQVKQQNTDRNILLNQIVHTFRRI